MRVIVFSRDRACQLDLLLRSLGLNAPQLGGDVHVLIAASDESYLGGYDVCMDEHPDVFFHPELDFGRDVRGLLEDSGEHVVFLTDDSLFYRPLGDAAAIGEALGRPEILCVSLRLGRNTTVCYPLARKQAVPLLPFHSSAGDVHSRLLAWEWRRAECDFAYPGSVDGHVFRRDDLRVWLDGDGFANPNELEEALVRGCASSDRRLMACFAESVLVGVPLNRVQSHHKNRAGEKSEYAPAALNDVYLAGGRLSLDVDPALVDGAHAELPLEFE